MLQNSRFRAFTLAFALLFALSPVTQAQKEGRKSGLSGRVDWKKGVIYATGLGAIPKDEPNDATAYLKARSFARMDARRNLLAVVDHVKIDSQTVGQDFQAVNDTIREEVSGIIKGSEIFSERKLKIGNGMLVEVTVTMPLYGADSLGSVLYPALAEKNREGTRGMDEEPVHPAPRNPVPDDDTVRGYPDKPFTGVIIDARVQGVERSMSPKIRRKDGSEVWGTLRVAPDYVLENGIVGYVHTLAEARKNGRAGSNPLLLHASGLYGRKFKTDATLTEADADRLLVANRRDGFLDQFHVIFVVDADK